MNYILPARIGNRNIHLCPLYNDEQRKNGYQNIFTEPVDEGLLFIFNDEEPRKFHMKNVNFDLDLLGFNKNGLLIFVIKMKKGSDIMYDTLPCKYAVETKSGWSNGIDIGASKLIICR
jgi:hypothetical protein